MNFIRDERGVVSILTAVFFSILVMIVTVGTLVVQTRELRQSTDSDQSIRAYYAAETGLDRALLELKRTTGTFRTGDNCNHTTPAVSDQDSELEITCFRVSANTLSGSGHLNQEQATQFDLKNEPNLGRIELEWHERDASAGEPGVFAGMSDFTGSASILPAKPTWEIPAVIELTLYSFPESSIRPSDIQARTVLLRPSGSGTTVDINDVSQIHPAKCDRSESYTCRAVISNIPTSIGSRSSRHVVRFRPRYAGTDYAITFRNSSNQAITPSTGGVKIDITARAGEIFRRVIATTTGGGQPLQYGLDYTILSQRSICKDMTITPSNGRVRTDAC